MAAITSGACSCHRWVRGGPNHAWSSSPGTTWLPGSRSARPGPRPGRGARRATAPRAPPRSRSASSTCQASVLTTTRSPGRAETPQDLVRAPGSPPRRAWSSATSSAAARRRRRRRAKSRARAAAASTRSGRRAGPAQRGPRSVARRVDPLEADAPVHQEGLHVLVRLAAAGDAVHRWPPSSGRPPSRRGAGRGETRQRVVGVLAGRRGRPRSWKRVVVGRHLGLEAG